MTVAASLVVVRLGALLLAATSSQAATAQAIIPVTVTAEFQKETRASLGTVVHIRGEVVFILTSSSVLVPADRSDDAEPRLTIRWPDGGEAAGTPFPAEDGKLNLRLVTGRITAARDPDQIQSMIMLRTGLEVPTRTTAFDFAGGTVPVNLVKGVLQSAVGQIAEGSSVVDDRGHLVGFALLRSGDQLAVVSAKAAADVLRTRWHVPANRLSRPVRLRSVASRVSAHQVLSIIQQHDLALRASELGALSTEPRSGSFFPRLKASRSEGLVTVSDEATALTWLPWNNEEFQYVCNPYEKAFFTAELATECALRLHQLRAAGGGGWRLPTVEELMSLVEHPEALQDSARQFLRPADGGFANLWWTSDAVADMNDWVWAVCIQKNCGAPIPRPAVRYGGMIAVRSLE